MGRRLRCLVGTRSRAPVVACPLDAKRAGPAAQERILTGPPAQFERNDVTIICETRCASPLPAFSAVVSLANRALSTPEAPPWFQERSEDRTKYRLHKARHTV